MFCEDKVLIINGKEARSPEQQIYKNMEDIKELKNYIKEAYKTSSTLTSSSTSDTKANTNVPDDVKDGWLLTSDGLLFKITGNDNTTLLISFYASLQGPQGEAGTDGVDGTDGVTPIITAAANVDSQVGTPGVTVTKTGTDEAPTFIFSFHNLKGETGTSLIEVEVVASLPASGQSGILYFVPSSDPSAQNLYDEYIWINSGWEKLGTQTIDLTNYIQKSYTAGLVKNDGTIDTTEYAPNTSVPTPNPTFDGTEAILTGLKFGNLLFKTKPLYFHPILLSYANNFRIMIFILNQKSTAYTRGELKTEILGFTGRLIVTGSFRRNDGYNYIASDIETDGSNIYLNGMNSNGTNIENIRLDNIWESITTIIDYVNQIL